MPHTPHRHGISSDGPPRRRRALLLLLWLAAVLLPTGLRGPLAAAATGCQACTIWPDTATPAAFATTDTQPVELGVRFQAAADGYVTGVRFYKTARPGAGQWWGSLWTITGQRLATAMHGDPSATGWQQVTFAAPVAVTANTTYVASYFAPAGGYAYTAGGFANGPVVNGPLQALANADGGNGLYHYGATSAFPNASGNGTNYWADVLFEDLNTPPTISAVRSTVVSDRRVTVEWTTDRPASTRVEYGTTTAYGSLTGGVGPTTSHVTELVGLQGGTTYRYRVLSQDATGDLATSADFTFTTAPPDTTPPVISNVQAVPDSGRYDRMTIRWTTDENASAEVEYGTTTAYGKSTGVRDAVLLTDHSWLLGSLEPVTTYHYRVKSKDLNGNLAVSGDLTFTTAAGPPPDERGPQISSLQATAITPSSATIAWTTDEPSDTQVEYGVGYRTALDTALVTSHSQTLTGLAPDTFYSYRAFSRDAAGNLSFQDGASFKTLPDRPVISAVKASVTGHSSATITWTTDVPSSSRVVYGGSSTPVDSVLVTSHMVTLTGLSAQTTYAYTVESTDAANRTGTSTGYSFTTPADTTGGTDTTAPSIGAVHAISITQTSVTITWTTDEPSDSQVQFAESSTPIDGALVTGHAVPVAGLSPGTTYSYRVRSADAAGNAGFSASLTFTTAGPADTTAPTVTARDPAPNATGVDSGVVVSATFSELTQGVFEFTLRDDQGTQVPAIVSKPPGALTATLAPSALLRPGTTYFVTLRGVKDLSGNPMPDDGWSFTTAMAPCPCTLFAEDATPGIASVGAGGPIELGVRFRSSIAGYVTGVRFFKGQGNGGTHVGRLWSASGQLLASATFADQTASGWQRADFAPPVQIAADATYVVSYFAPTAAYAYDGGYFATAKTRGPLTALGGGNGVFRDGSSGFPDQNYNNANYWVDPVFALTPPPDTTAPRIVGRSPAVNATDAGQRAGVTATFSEPVQSGTITFALRDGAGAAVAGSVAYDAASRTATFTPTGALALGATYTATVSGAADPAGNVMAADNWSFSTPSCPCTVWADSATPGITSVGAGGPIELGVKFRADVDGYVTGVRFYKGDGSTGTHVGKLWSSGGQLLASATFTGETAAGWQRVDFSPAVHVTAGSTYVASYFAPNGGYAYDGAYFAGHGTSRGPLTALADGADGASGLYRYGSSGFPTSSYHAANCWVDPVFALTPPPDTTAPTVIPRAPASGAADAGLTAAVTAAFSEPVQAGTIGFVLRDGAGAVVPATPAYDAATNTATLTPNAPLALGAAYTAEVSGATDPSGNAMAPVAWSFSTPACACSLFSDAVSPFVASVTGGGPIELGVKLVPSVDGYITGVRFYKGAGNTGTHVGKLWSATGQLLASATFAAETASGWQRVDFSPAVRVTANTTYVASYFAPNGGYAYDPAYFASAASRGPLRAPASGADGGNGLYRAGSDGFPSDSYNATNYWVDVLFATTPPPDTTAPRLVGRTPASAAADAGINGPVRATFGEPIQPATLAVVLRDAAGAPVAASVSYQPETNTATLIPNAPLALGASYTAEVSGAADLAGNAMAIDSWSFSTPSCPCSLWSDAATPAVTTLVGGGPIELGLRFRTEVGGFVTGLRFYKGAHNTGTHVGHLWSADGVLLAAATFTGETESGWQRVTFASPVPVSANTDYVVSYYAPDGGYAYDPAYFANSRRVTSGPLGTVAVAGNGAGLYRVGTGGLPTDSYNAANYWVDAVFTSTP